MVFFFSSKRRHTRSFNKQASESERRKQIHTTIPLTPLLSGSVSGNKRHFNPPPSKSHLKDSGWSLTRRAKEKLIATIKDLCQPPQQAASIHPLPTLFGHSQVADRYARLRKREKRVTVNYLASQSHQAGNGLDHCFCKGTLA